MTIFVFENEKLNSKVTVDTKSKDDARRMFFEIRKSHFPETDCNDWFLTEIIELAVIEFKLS